MSKRERIEILREVLELCKTPKGKTQIVYRCNLNFKIVKPYLSECLSKGWIEKIDTKYQTTTLGKDYLNMLIPVLQMRNVQPIQNL